MKINHVERMAVNLLNHLVLVLQVIAKYNNGERSHNQEGRKEQYLDCIP